MLQVISGRLYFDSGTANPPQKVDSNFCYTIRAANFRLQPTSHFIFSPSVPGPCRDHLLPARAERQRKYEGTVNNGHCLLFFSSSFFQDLFQRVAQHVVADAGQVRTERGCRLCHALLDTASVPSGLDHCGVSCSILSMMRLQLWKISR
jgi:hypothetical protein